MALTHAQARAAVLRLLDDADKDRWDVSSDGDDTDPALRAAMNKCILELTDEGATRFVEQTESSFTSGLLSMSSEDPLDVRDVSVKVNGYWQRIPAVGRGGEFERFTDVNYDCRVSYVANTALPGATSSPLVTGPTYDALEEWIVARAAARLAVIDTEKLPALAALVADARSGAMSIARIPMTLVRPEFVSVSNLGWTYRHDDKQVELVRRWEC